MRDDYPTFNALGTEILVVTRHEKAEMQSYWQKEKIPYIGISDPEGKITEQYGQQRKKLSLGPMPAQFLIDCQGKLGLCHYGKGKSDIISDEKLFEMLQLVRLKSNCPDRPATQDDEDDGW